MTSHGLDEWFRAMFEPTWTWPNFMFGQLFMWIGANNGQIWLPIGYMSDSEQCSASPDGSAVWGVVVSTRWWLLVDHCVLRNWGRILVRAVKGLISRVGMVSICPLLWQRDIKLQQTKPNLAMFGPTWTLPNLTFGQLFMWIEANNDQIWLPMARWVILHD